MFFFLTKCKNSKCKTYYVVRRFFLLCLLLEHTARYVGLLLAPAEGFGRGIFSGKNRAFFAVLANFWCPVVTLVILVVTLVTLKGIPNNERKKIKK